jgi:2'-5' RNA ligase
MPRDRRKFTKERPPDPDAVDTRWRLFLAVDFPASHQAQLNRLLQLVSASELPIRWIGANAAHMTLHFLGETDVEMAELLRMGFAGATGGARPFKLRVDGAGAFPNLTRPQIVWLGLAGDVSSLQELHRAAGDFLRQFEIEPEDRPFKPHITLGRARQRLESPQINALVSLMRSPGVKQLLAELETPFAVDHITLYRSHLSSSGSTYEALATARLS